MWKPVRLQGVGAASSIIDSNAFPSGRLLEPWRRHVNCLFGLTLNGVPLGTAPYDPDGKYTCPDAIAGWKYYGSDLTGAGGGTPNTNVPQVDRIPLEAVLGWDATLNGNLAEQLQEPSLMGAYEGAGITVLGKGVWTPPGQPSFGLEGAFPAGSLLLQNVAAALDETGAVINRSFDYCHTPVVNSTTELVPNPYPSNFECNPSSIDGLTIRDSSQGGGGVFVHGWNHNLQIANNRINNNVRYALRRNHARTGRVPRSDHGQRRRRRGRRGDFPRCAALLPGQQRGRHAPALVHGPQRQHA